MKRKQILKKIKDYGRHSNLYRTDIPKDHCTRISHLHIGVFTSTGDEFTRVCDRYLSQLIRYTKRNNLSIIQDRRFYNEVLPKQFFTKMLKNVQFGKPITKLGKRIFIKQYKEIIPGLYGTKALHKIKGGYHFGVSVYAIKLLK